jgi:hypothetical protein
MGLARFLFISLSIASIACFGQSENSIVEKTNTYFRAWPEPKLILWFSQDKYSPGDTVFFRAFYQLDPEPIVSEELMDVFLIGTDGGLILSHKFLVDGGVGAGQLILPDTLKGGLYLIMARTNWMRNFNKQFEQVLTVVDDHQIVTTATGSIRFRTESGQLVASLQNRVYFNSDRAEAEFEICDAQGEVILKQATNKYGSGSFTIIPQANYYLQWVGDSAKHLIPKMVSEGIQLNSEQTQADLRIHVTGTQTPLQFLLTGNGKVLYFKEHTGNGTIEIPRDSLPSGIIKLNAITPMGKSIASRDYYVSKPLSTIPIQVAKNSYVPGERVEASFSTSGGTWAFRVSNTQAGAVGKHDHRAWLRAGFTSPYPMDSITQRQLDQWLLVETKELPWKDILQPASNRTRYASLNVIERRGQVFNSATQLPVEATTQVLLYLQQKKFLFQTFTGPDARVSVAIPGLLNADEFFYMGEFRGKRIPITIRWDQEEQIFPKPPPFTVSDTPDSYGIFRSRVRLINDSFEAFGKIVTVDATPPITTFESLMGEPDINLQMGDFIAFPTMRELIKEVVPSLSVRTNKNGSFVRVALATWVPTQDPVYIIDGRATTDTEGFLNLRPTDVKTIGIYNTPLKLIRLGLMGKQGIVIVTTTKPKKIIGEPANLIEGIGESLTLPEVKVGAAPVYRSTLYWNPANKSNGISFIASDDLGEMKLEAIGLINGVPSFQSASFSTNLKRVVSK